MMCKRKGYEVQVGIRGIVAKTHKTGDVSRFFFQKGSKFIFYKINIAT